MNPRNYPVWKWNKVGQELSGVIQAPPFPVGKRRSILYSIKEDDPRGRGKSWRLYGTYEIDQACAMLPPGSHVSMKYLGKVPSEKNPNNTYFHFKIRVSTKGTGYAEQQRRGAARAAPLRQHLPEPASAVGRSGGPRAAAKNKVVKEKRGRNGDGFAGARTSGVRLPAPPRPAPAPAVVLARAELDHVTAPPPGPPGHVLDLSEWSKRVKRL